MVLRQLREAENRAKNAGRDRFCIRVLKRGGGEVSVIGPWWNVPQDDEQHPVVERSGIALLKRIADELAATEFSRGAIYRAQLWFEGLTDNREDTKLGSIWREQVTGTLAYQFGRQKGHPELAREVVDFVCDIVKPAHPLTTLNEFLVTAEFFAREARAIAARGREKRNKQMEEASA
jgi:CRISPR-associated protein Cmr2